VIVQSEDIVFNVHAHHIRQPENPT
jgi:hypothetical protein